MFVFLFIQQECGEGQREQLKQVIDREPLAPMFEQDKELVWHLRYDSSTVNTLASGFAHLPLLDYCFSVLWNSVAWCGVAWRCVMVWSGVVWCGVLWSGVEWHGVVWHGV